MFAIKSVRYSAGLALTLALVGAECWGSGGTVVPRPPIGGDQRNCVITPSSSWGANWPELTYAFDTTRHCPYTSVVSGSPMPFKVKFRVSPYGLTQLYHSSLYHIRNSSGTIVAQAANIPFIREVPGDPNSFQYSVIDATYPSGTGIYPFRDSASVVVYGGYHVPLYPSLSIVLPGRVESAPPSISGQTFVVAYYAQGWSAIVSEEPNSYRYTWSVDGVVVSSGDADHLIHTLDPGMHTIGLTSTRSDGTVSTSSMSVQAVDCGGPYIC